ncbi:MAG: YfhO family protein [Ferruginibacter sp.]
MKLDIKKLLPHFVAIVVFLVIAVVFCKPALEGKVVYQHDLQGWRGMVQQSFEFKDVYGHYPLWTNSMFGGMPAYQIAMNATHSFSLGFAQNLLSLGLPQPINFFFLACICFYFLCIVLRVNPWLAILGGIAYAYSTYDPVIIMVGHVTKMATMAYAPAVLGAFLLILQKKYWTGTALLILFCYLMIAQNHVQIVYYLLIICVVVAITFLVKAIKEKELGHIVLAGVLSIIAGIIGLGGSAVTLLPTAEFTKETMRGGKSELTDTTNLGNKTKGGLDKDYAFSWSYGINETLTLMIPGSFGGSSNGELKGNSAVAKTLVEQGVPEDNANQIAVSLPTYWGPQPNTSGPVYLGAIICFLFVLGMVYLDSWHKWWILVATLIGIILAWGSNFKSFNYFIFDHLPMYSKFRAPTMSLVIPQLTAALMASLVLQKFLFGGDAKELLFKKLKLSAYITAGILGFAALLYFSSSYSGSNDNRIKENFANNMLASAQGQASDPSFQAQANEFGQSIVRALAEDRKAMFGRDLLRSLIFITLAIFILGLFSKNKLSGTIAAIALAALTLIDLYPVGKRYLNENNFVEKVSIEDEFTENESDKIIKADPDHKNFRIYNADDPYNNAKPSFHHNSVGGYNPAKLAIYQDLIERQLSKGNMKVFNMLNTKYFVVQNPQTGAQMAQMNPDAMGNVWFVKQLQFVKDADAEMKALDNLNPLDTAIIDKRYQSLVKGVPQYDSSAYIRMIDNINDTVRYQYNAITPQFAVFSEIYYDKGWNVYVDEKKANYVRVNYVLRGMSLPAGKHNIEFRFEPTSYQKGNTISLLSSIIGSIFILIVLIINLMKKRIV